MYLGGVSTPPKFRVNYPSLKDRVSGAWMKQLVTEILVLGGGPGGYVAAIRAAQRGRSVVLVEARELGGTCLNRGCIPTKALLSSAETLKKIRHAETQGIEVGPVKIHVDQMQQRKDQIVDQIRSGLEGLVAANKITVVRGHGKFVGPQEIKIMGQDNAVITADRIIIATGSEPRSLPTCPVDGEAIHSSDSLLQLQTLPKKLIIIGGGVIGCEFASFYRELGSEVTILEMAPSLIAQEGTEVAEFLAGAFRKRGIEIQTGIMVNRVERAGKGILVRIEGQESIQADQALIAVGRSLNTQICLDAVGVATNERGAILVNSRMETNMQGIYAIGDVTGRWLLAHVASHQGLVAADNACGIPSEMHYDAVPSVIFTDPEVATVGMTLEKAKAAGFDAVKAKFPFQALGKAQAILETEGFAQLIVEKKTQRILGAQVVGHEATSLIAEVTTAIHNELTTECISEAIHAHPTFPEGWAEAALLAQGLPLHLPPAKR